MRVKLLNMQKKCYNVPYIPVVDVNFPTDELITQKLTSVLPYSFIFENMLTTQQITNYYLMAFFRLPDVSELNYWEGKSLDQMLEAGLRDRRRLLEDNI